MFQFSMLSIRARRLLIAAAAVALGMVMQWQAGNTFDEWLRDNFVRIAAKGIPESRLTVVDIDEQSLAEAGPWPWPRSRIAEFVESLIEDYGAKRVALDMVLPSPADQKGDEELARLSRSGKLVLAEALDYVRRPAPLDTGVLSGGYPVHGPMPEALGYIANHAGLGDAVAGNIGFMPDRDGVLRHLPLWTSFRGRAYPTLALALCCAQSPPVLPSERIPYSRSWSSYTVVPVSDILNLRAPLSRISGRLVLVGSSALGLSDRVSTPLSSSTAGVMVHAAELSTLLDAREGLLPRPWPGKPVAALYSLLVAVLAVYTFPRFSALSNMALLGAPPSSGSRWPMPSPRTTPPSPQAGRCSATSSCSWSPSPSTGRSQDRNPGSCLPR